MRLYEVIWKDKFADKIAGKHKITTYEAEEVLFSHPHIRKAEKGRVQAEDLYAAYGQTSAGRNLVVFFIRKYQTAALPISAREMTQSERRYFEQHKKDH